MNSKFPAFDSYACIGDSRTLAIGDYELTAMLHADTDSTPFDADCYSEENIAAWRADEWFYVGIVISVKFRDVIMDRHAASLWGVDCNFSKDSNSYLSEAASEMIDEALSSANAHLDALLQAAAQLAS